MSLVFAGVCSHAPGITGRAHLADPAVKDEFHAQFHRFGEAMRATKPDAVIVIAAEHFANFFMNNMPAYAIGMADSYEGPIEDPKWLGIGKHRIPGDAALSQRLIREVMQTVDVAYAEEWKFDHGIMVPLNFLTPKFDTKVIPVNINCQGPPLTPLHRAWAFGEALRLACDKVPERIALVGTGGISQFQEPTVDDLAAKITELYRQDPHLKGLVLDLRNDPGGVLQGAIGVAAAFLPKDTPIVSTNGQLPDSKQIFYGRAEYYSLRGDGDPLAKLPEAVKHIPMAVLVNTGSASASEIVAGALQDYKRATIIGSQTFGKGSVQTIRQLTADTAVKLTTARYYTPHGRSIQAKGISPDLAVDENEDGDGLNSLRMREADLAKHLSNDRDQEAGKAPRDELEEQMRILAAEKKRKPLEYGSGDDFQLKQALNHLQGVPVQLAKADSKLVKLDPPPKK